MIKDYYSILNVHKDCSDTDIKKAFRDLAIQLHPDKNKALDAHERFVELNEAFQILSVEESRERYDQLYNQKINPSPGSNITSEEEFGPIKDNAHREAEKTARMDFTLFISEFLTEMIGYNLVAGVVDGLGSVIKGTGEVLGDVFSGIDL